MPNRMIRESCRTSLTLDALSDFGERFFWRLTTVADDFGRFEAHPAVLTAACFPLRCGTIKPEKITIALQELVACGLVTAYATNGKPYGMFNTWDRHQIKRAKHSKYPGPPVSAREQPTVSADICQQTQTSVGTCEQTQANVSESREARVEKRESRSESREAGDGQPSPAAGASLEEVPRSDQENRKSTPGIATPDWIVAAWNQIPGVVTFNGAMQGAILAAITARLNEHKTMAWWVDYFKVVQAADWLCGRNDAGWAAPLVWAMGPKNIGKVLAGGYPNRQAPQAATPTSTSVAKCNHHPATPCGLQVCSTTGSERRCAWHSHLDRHHPEILETREAFDRYWGGAHESIRKGLTAEQAWAKTNRDTLAMVS